MKLALVGCQIQSSLSPRIYQELSNNQVEYKLIDIPLDSEVPKLQNIFNHYHLDGLSITAPFKKNFMSEALVLGDWPSINAVRKKIRGNKTIYEAINTDELAIRDIWPEIVSCYGDRPIQILGDGAMSEIVNNIFGDKVIGVFSRKKCNLKSDAISHNLSGSIIINTCLKSYIFPRLIGNNYIIWDLNYGSDKNRIYCSDQGIPYIDGLSLLRRQAKYAYDFFLNKSF